MNPHLLVHLMLPEQRDFYDPEHLRSGFTTKLQRFHQHR